MVRAMTRRKAETETPPETPEPESPIEILDRGYPDLTFREIADYKADPRHYLAGDGFIRRGAGTLLIGGTGVGKSVLVEQFAVSLAAGLPLMGRIAVKKPLKVLMIEAENDLDVLNRDMVSIARHIKADIGTLTKNLVVKYAPGCPAKLFPEFLESALERVRPDVVILDPYQSFVGGADLNNTATFLGWMGPVNALITTYMTGFVLVGHTPKPKDRDDWTSREMVYLFAGTSAASNWARTSCELIQVKGEGSRFRLHFSKSAERTGLVDSRGAVVRDLFIEHSHSIREPYWQLSDMQEPMIKANVEDMVRAEHEKNPGLSIGVLAKNLGLSKATIHRYLKSKKRERK